MLEVSRPGGSVKRDTLSGGAFSGVSWPASRPRTARSHPRTGGPRRGGRPARGENWCKNGAFWCKNGRSHPRARHSAGRGLGELLGLPALSCENGAFSCENARFLTRTCENRAFSCKNSSALDSTSAPDVAAGSALPPAHTRRIIPRQLGHLRDANAARRLSMQSAERVMLPRHHAHRDASRQVPCAVEGRHDPALQARRRSARRRLTWAHVPEALMLPAGVQPVLQVRK